jgi:DNA polymerase III delta prime subunit
VLISCGCEINAFAAERFATLFFNHVGRPGTYYDAYKNASALICLLNGNLRFREFYHYDELMNSKADFDYAFIDIDKIAKNAASGSQDRASAPAAEPTAAKQPGSIISTDKKTMDVLSANYLKDCLQTISKADAIKSDPQKVNVLQSALDATEKLAKGDLSKAEVKNIWQEAERVVPGIDSKTDFQSLVNMQKGGYEKVMNQFFKKDEETPTITKLQETITNPQ